MKSPYIETVSCVITDDKDVEQKLTTEFAVGGGTFTFEIYQEDGKAKNRITLDAKQYHALLDHMTKTKFVNSPENLSASE